MMTKEQMLEIIKLLEDSIEKLENQNIEEKCIYPLRSSLDIARKHLLSLQDESILV